MWPGETAVQRENREAIESLVALRESDPMPGMTAGDRAWWAGVDLEDGLPVPWMVEVEYLGPARGFSGPMVAIRRPPDKYAVPGPENRTTVPPGEVFAAPSDAARSIVAVLEARIREVEAIRDEYRAMTVALGEPTP